MCCNGQDTPCWNADGRRAFASQTAQSLNAEWRQVGFGRLGLLIGGNGGVPVANDAFNWIYKDVPRDDWQPDLVVVNQGTNDGSASSASFRPAYATYLKTIRTGYPLAKIAAMRPFNGAHAADIKAEVDARRAAGDSKSATSTPPAGWQTAITATAYTPTSKAARKRRRPWSRPSSPSACPEASGSGQALRILGNHRRGPAPGVPWAQARWWHPAGSGDFHRVENGK